MTKEIGKYHTKYVFAILPMSSLPSSIARHRIPADSSCHFFLPITLFCVMYLADSWCS